MNDIKIVEQISSFKKIKLGDNSFRLAFYNIAKEFWSLEQYYLVLDKASYLNDLKLPLIREYKGTLAVQFFTSKMKAEAFVEKHQDNFKVNEKQLIVQLGNKAFTEIFAPFFASQNFNYIINDPEEHFLDTFDRLLAVLEIDNHYKLDKQQEALLKKKDYKSFYLDICNQYLKFAR